jgi:hypothetical protein
MRARLVVLLTDQRTIDGCAFSFGAIFMLALRVVLAL